jgi:hypothetical protein
MDTTKEWFCAVCGKPAQEMCVATVEHGGQKHDILGPYFVCHEHVEQTLLYFAERERQMLTGLQRTIEESKERYDTVWPVFKKKLEDARGERENADDDIPKPE